MSLDSADAVIVAIAIILIMAVVGVLLLVLWALIQPLVLIFGRWYLLDESRALDAGHAKALHSADEDIGGSPGPPARLSLLVCHHCGAANVRDASECARCGVPLDENPSEAT
jgi:hypothetical protein